MISEGQKEARRTGVGTEECDHCGEEYEEWLAVIPDNVDSLYEWTERKREYENLCQECNEKYFEGKLGFEKEQ